VELTLPPRLSAARFRQALQAFEGVVGKGWVLATDEDRDAYSDIYAPGSEKEWPASAALAPGSVEEVQAIVRLANQYKTPLWPTSRGKNLGYGANAPRMPGTIVLDARSRQRFDELHVKGAMNLSFPDITVDSLQKTIPDRNTRILIYCNNNVSGAEGPFPTKAPSAALNISTFTGPSLSRSSEKAIGPCAGFSSGWNANRSGTTVPPTAVVLVTWMFAEATLRLGVLHLKSLTDTVAK